MSEGVRHFRRSKKNKRWIKLYDIDSSIIHSLKVKERVEEEFLVDENILKEMKSKKIKKEREANWNFNDKCTFRKKAEAPKTPVLLTPSVHE